MSASCDRFGRGLLRAVAASALVLTIACPFAPGGPPPLPAGLGADGNAPALPSGLGTSDAPPLPIGLGDGDAKTDEKRAPGEGGAAWLQELPFDVTGFWEARAGRRLHSDPDQHRTSIGETRLQLQLDSTTGPVSGRATGDLLFDPVLDRHDVDLEEGEGWFDLRELHLLVRPVSFVDLKAGRQVLTWGTGDLLFINDLFPKDWNSFFIGRDDEYLKAPSDAVKVSLFGGFANLDVVYTPRFDSDRFIDGRRVSYWNGALGDVAGNNAVVNPERRDNWLDHDEWAARLYRTLRGYECAAYFYDGYWKSPGGQNPATGKPVFPPLRVVGLSLRGAVGRGIGSVEAGHYDSRDDRHGADPFTRNGELRFLAGYEQEAAKNLTVGGQYYVEHMMDYDAYRRRLGPGMPEADRTRQVLTGRLTYLMLNQNLTLSLFAYFSPTDRDAYLRPKAHYKASDRWSVEAGGNVFLGSDDHTFFGQFERTTNAYAGVRLGF